ncbi:hypothetical protein ACHAXT_011482 [Thalassiosira profunda]
MIVVVATRRQLVVLASVILAWETFFLLVADRHITSTHQLLSGYGALQPQPPEHGKDSAGGHQPQRTQWRQGSPYTPDFATFNASRPPELYASSPGSLPSLPDIHRVPAHVMQARNFTEHYATWDAAKDPHTLFVYNPSIVPLHASGWPADTPAEARYLATFRVSSIHSCGFPTYAFWKHAVDNVGLALMDGDLRIATLGGDSLDIIVDINAHLPKIFGGRTKVQDVRLFVLHGRVFMSSGVFLVPICVTVGGMVDSSPTAICTNGDGSMEELPALYRKNDRLRLFVSGDAIRLKGTDGKNFQFFGASSDRNASVMMEYWPHQPREIHDLGDAIAKQFTKGSSSRKRRIVSVEGERKIKSETAPDPISKVAKSLDSSLKTFIKRDRSSA